ncbi:hypothetical protein Q8G47_29525, partial [Klebsiella pneumoniae]|uniref:hypothetical protein n=1 Tax=Klebsiella pneumoniae TaxID=573 RepID=UPI0030137933
PSHAAQATRAMDQALERGRDMAGCATVLFCPSEWSKVLEGDEEPKRGQKSGVRVRGLDV